MISATPGCLPIDGFQVARLRAQPVPEEVDGVVAQRGKECVPRLGHGNSLNKLGEVVIQARYFLEHTCVAGIVDERNHLHTQGIFDADLYIVNRR